MKLHEIYRVKEWTFSAGNIPRWWKIHYWIRMAHSKEQRTTSKRSFLGYTYIFLAVNWFARSSSYSCHDGNNRTITVEKGEEVNFKVLISSIWAQNGNALVWKKAGDNYTIGKCSGDRYNSPQGAALDNITCQQGTGKYVMNINKVCHRLSICYLYLRMTTTGLNDSGIYHVELEGLCTYLTANITVQETKPICQTVLQKEEKNLKLSCKWSPRSKNDEARLLIGNRTLYSYHNYGLVYNGNSSIMNEIKAVVSLDEAVDRKRAPYYSCVISQFNFQKGCNFFNSHSSVTTHRKNNGVIFSSFACCTMGNNLPKVWLYTQTKLLTLNTADGFQQPTENLTHCPDEEFEFVIFCGEDAGQDLRVHGIERLTLQDCPASLAINFTVRDTSSHSNSSHYEFCIDVAVYITYRHNIFVTVNSANKSLISSITSTVSDKQTVLPDGKSSHLMKVFVASDSNSNVKVWILVLVISSLALLSTFRLCFIKRTCQFIDVKTRSTSQQTE